MEKKVNTERTLLDTYLSYHNLILRSTTHEPPKRDGMTFMPMLLMDAMNLLYEEYIAPLPLRHKEKQLRTRWHESYKHYINQEFMAFDDEQKCEICEIMDDFELYIHNEIEIFRVTAMGKFLQYDTDIRLVLSATLCCNLLAQGAQMLWSEMRKNNNGYIQSVESWSLKFLNEYANTRIEKVSTSTDLNKYQDLRQATKGVCNKIISFAEGIKF